MTPSVAKRIKQQQGITQRRLSRALFQQYRSKADIEVHSCDVRFTPKRRHRNSAVKCLLCAKSGHRVSYSITSSARESSCGGTKKLRMLCAKCLRMNLEADPPSRKSNSKLYFIMRTNCGSIDSSRLD